MNNTPNEILYEMISKFKQLDRVDQGRAIARIDYLLENEKYHMKMNILYSGLQAWKRGCGMIKQRMARGTLLNRLRELEESQKNKQAIPVLFADVEENGRLWVGKNISDKHYFENMFDVEAYMTALPGFTEQTKVLIDDLLCWPEGLYLPSDPILYFMDSEKRSDFVRVNTDPEKRLALYIALIKHVLETAETKSALPGFDTPALKDLIENMDSMNIEQLVERYKDSKWFNGTIKI